MAQTHTLTADTLISSLSLASGDTIQLAGHSLIVDMDAVSTPVTIGNSGGDANLELRDLSRIKLNAMLPLTVHPYIDPEHPLPVSDDAHAIDGDGYRTTLTANARAEIQLASGFTFGGGNGSLPTETRPGNFWAIAKSYPAGNQIELDREVNIHVGDILQYLSDEADTRKSTVLDYNESQRIVTIDSTVSLSPGGVWALVAGGVCLTLPDTNVLTPIFQFGSLSFGTLIVVGYNPSNGIGSLFGTGTDPSITISFSADRLLHAPAKAFNAGWCGVVGNNVSVDIKECAAPNLVGRWGSAATYYPVNANIKNGVFGNVFSRQDITIGNGSSIEARGHIVAASINPMTNRARFIFSDCSLAGTYYEKAYFMKAGTATLEEMQNAPIKNAFFHAPVTAKDSTWRYEDYVVRPHAVLRIRALWKRGENSAAAARAAITDPTNWYPGTQGGALAETVFHASANDSWQESRIEWRNDGDTDAQVRVWETVTGDTAGGYLRTIEATGGPM